MKYALWSAAFFCTLIAFTFNVTTYAHNANSGGMKTVIVASFAAVLLALGAALCRPRRLMGTILSTLIIVMGILHTASAIATLVHS